MTRTTEEARFTVRLTKEQHELLTHRTRHMGVPTITIIRALVYQYLNGEIEVKL